jgi:putative glycosyltransferase (TIGR04372 family)
MFRVPTLITNLTSISRNALSSDTSLYMPKFLYTENGRKLEMDELLSSRFSFGGEFAHSQLKREGLIMRQNDERQILEGAEELISRTKKGKIELSITDQEIRQLQQNSRTVAFGLFANSLF